MFELKDELQKYFQETNKQDFANCFEDEHWLKRLSYLADMNFFFFHFKFNSNLYFFQKQNKG